jgi:hypothetical protein
MIKELSHKLRALLGYAFEKDKIIYTCIIALSLFRLIHQSLKYLLESSFIDLAYHYFYSSMVRLGLDLFDAQAIEKAKILIPIRYAGGEAVYSPSYFVIFQPLTCIPFGPLSAFWLSLCLFLVLLSLIWLFRTLHRFDSPLMVAFTALLVGMYQPLYEDLVLGQNNSLILFLAVSTWYAFRYQKPWLSGFSIAAMAFIKIQFGFLLLFVLLLRKAKVFLISSLFWIVLFFIGLPELGFAHYERYLWALIRHTSGVATDLHNISLNALWHRFFADDPHLATIVYLISSLILLSLVLFSCFKNKLHSNSERAFIAGLTLIPLLSPHTEEHHLVPILLPLVFVSFYIQRMSFCMRFMYLISVVLIASRYSWIRLAPTNSIILAPLLSLKILGVLCLLIVVMNLKTSQSNLTNCQERTI